MIAPRREVEACRTLLKQVLNFHRLLGEIHDYDVWVRELLPGERKKKDLTLEDKDAIDHLTNHCRKLRAGSYEKFIAAWEKTNKVDQLKDTVKSL